MPLLGGPDYRTIMVLNAKGGSGKSTLSTNLASFYRLKGIPVAIADYDPQGSSIDWLAARPANIEGIEAINAVSQRIKPAKNTQILILDTPAGLHGADLKKLVAKAGTAIVPILPSPIDIRAATRFLNELMEIRRIEKGQTRIGVVANRVRETTHAYYALDNFLSRSRIPLITTLRDSQIYNHASSLGVSIFDLPRSQTKDEIDRWKPLLAWLESDYSKPVK